MESLKNEFQKMNIELMDKFEEKLDKWMNKGVRYFDSKAMMNKVEKL